MRALLIIFSLTCSTILLAQQSIQVTSRTLTDWAVVSADSPTSAGQADLVLPAGAQIARTFPAGDLVLQFTTRPFIGANEADWPILELGSSALVFGRNGGTGRLLLVAGKGAPLELPFDFALDTDGRSVDLLVISFAREGSMVDIALRGRALRIPANTAANATLDVVASAGSTHPWAFEQLNVTVGSVIPVTATPAVSSFNLTGLSSSGPISSGPVGKGGTSGPVAVARTSGPHVPTTPTPVGGRTSSATPVDSKSVATLEIFTPPAVRRGRVNAIRAVAQNAGR